MINIIIGNALFRKIMAFWAAKFNLTLLLLDVVYMYMCACPAQQRVEKGAKASMYIVYHDSYNFEKCVRWKFLEITIKLAGMFNICAVP